jgi:hypothetical protein
MPIDLGKFKLAYEKWVQESLPDYQAGNVKEVIRKYPLIVSDDVPWTPYKGSPSEQTFTLVTEAVPKLLSGIKTAQVDVLFLVPV